MTTYPTPIDVMVMSKKGGVQLKLRNSDELEEFVMKVANKSTEQIAEENSHLFIPMGFFQSIAVAGLTMTESYYNLVEFLMDRGLLEKYDFSSVVEQVDIETVNAMKGVEQNGT